MDNSGRICGYYFDGSDVYCPYRVFSPGTTSTKNGLGGENTYISGITDAGDFCGALDLDLNYLIESFLTLADGRTVYFGIGGLDEANGINVHNGIAGDYMDTDSTVHRYLRDPEDFPDARILSSVDYPGYTSTFLLGLNDGGRVLVGKYVHSARATPRTDPAKTEHLHFLRLPGRGRDSLSTRSTIIK
jgi:hypothetical protein